MKFPAYAEKLLYVSFRIKCLSWNFVKKCSGTIRIEIHVVRSRRGRVIRAVTHANIEERQWKTDATIVTLFSLGRYIKITLDLLG